MGLIFATEEKEARIPGVWSPHRSRQKEDGDAEWDRIQTISVIIIIIMAGVVMPSETEFWQFWQGVSLTRVKLAEEQDQPGTNQRNTNKPKKSENWAKKQHWVKKVKLAGEQDQPRTDQWNTNKPKIVLYKSKLSTL